MKPSELRSYVIQRDGQCVAALLDLSHQCRDKWGVPHSPSDLDRLTLEHVKDQPMMGRKAPDEPHHAIALCHDANAVSYWGSANRALEKAYLAGVVSGERNRQ